MKYFITGVGGQLGFDLVRRLQAAGETVIGSDIRPENDFCAQYVKLDITDHEAVADALKEYRPDVVIHCAAWTAVDAAEDPENRDKVRLINVEGTKNIAEGCKTIDCKMIYISTDYVFDGAGEMPWDPDCREYSPLNYYGETKLEGELAVSGILEKYFIVRTAWVFGANGNNFVKTMLRLGKTLPELRVVNDQIGTPTYTFDLARLLVDIAKTERYGYYHATNEGGFISWYEFACEIMRMAGLSAKVVPVSTAEYGLSKAKRPFNSRLGKEKLTEAGFERLPDWKNALERYLKEIGAIRKMSKIKVTPCKIKGLYVIEPTVHGDSRGYFMETYNLNDMREAGLDMVFVQDNQSMSRRGVLRGLHYQKKFPQGKLVRVISGEVFDVAVDLRPGSVTYGKWHGEILSAENKKQFYIPEGFAHGFYVLSETAEFCYKVTDFYHSEDEWGIRWNDPDIGVEWPIINDIPVLLSEKDKVQPFLREIK